MKNKEWFETWFTSPYYRICYDLDHREVPEEFIHRLTHILSLKPGAPVLDLGCGLGKEAYYMESLGYDVTGVDLSEANITEALAMESETLAFYSHDMRSAFWINYYDCIFNLFTSFGFFETYVEHVQCLRNARKALRAGGKIVIDFMNADYVAENLIEHEEFNKGQIQFVIDSEIENGQLLKKIKIIDGEQCYFFDENIRMFTLDDFETMFAQSGLKIDHTYGNYDLDAFDHQRSERMIITGSKL